MSVPIFNKVADDGVALLDFDAQSPECARIDDASRTDNPRLSSGYAAMGVFKEIGIAESAFRDGKIGLIVASSKFGDGTR